MTGRATPPATRHPLPTTLSEIAAELGDLPLALHLAGSYLESYAGDPAGTPAALLAQLRDPVLGLQAAALIGRGAADSPTAHELHVANTFLLSWQRLATVTADGRVFELYYDRAPKGSDRPEGEWFLRYEIVE